MPHLDDPTNYALEHGCTPLNAPDPDRRIPTPVREILSVESLRGSANQHVWARAGHVLDTARITGLRCHGGKVTAQVASETGNTYAVSLGRGEFKTRTHGYLALECTCPAAAKPSTCKHSLAAGLHVLGYRPAPPVPTTPEQANDPLDGLDRLTTEQLRDVLAWASATHPDVAARIQMLHAHDGALVGLVTACKGSVDAVMTDYNWDKRWKQAGSTAATPLQELLQTTSETPSGSDDVWVAVIAGCVHAMTYWSVDDRYGDLIGVIAECLERLASSSDRLDALQRQQVARDLVDLSTISGSDAFDFLVGDEDDIGVNRGCAAFLPAVLGDAGRAVVWEAAAFNRAMAEAAEKLDGGRGVAQTRARQRSEANWRLDQCSQLGMLAYGRD